MPQPFEIQFNRPAVEGNEIAYMRQAIESGFMSSGGPFTKEVQGLLRNWFESEDVILTTSCTDALELAALMIDLEPGDEVIAPSYTFVSTALAFARAGASLVFADIEDQYLALDPDHVQALLTDRTRAIVTVHYAGIGGRVSELQSLARYGIDLIEDNAHGLFGLVGDTKLGTVGRFSTLSFHETKNFICGEGGALVVNHPDDVERAHVLTDKGTNRKAFFEGQVDKYSWQDIGSSFGLSDLLAGFLLGQLEVRNETLARRKQIFDRYMTGFSALQGETGIQLPYVPSDRTPAYHMFYILLPQPSQRTRFLSELRHRGIHATFHYVPLHSSPGGRSFSARETDLPVTDDIASRLVRLPFHNALEDQQIDRVTAETARVLRTLT